MFDVAIDGNDLFSGHKGDCANFCIVEYVNYSQIFSEVLLLAAKSDIQRFNDLFYTLYFGVDHGLPVRCLASSATWS